MPTLQGGVSSIDPAFYAGLRRLLCEMPSRFRFFFAFICVCHFFVVPLQPLFEPYSKP